MPKYTYKCADCDIVVDYHHSVTDIIRNCENCGVIDSLARLPSKFYIPSYQPKQNKVGGIVKTAIKDFRSDLEEEKERLQSKEYSSSD